MNAFKSLGRDGTNDRRWLFDRATFVAGCAIVFVALRAAAADDKPSFARWEKEIAAFEKADAKSPPPKGGVLFVGSSSIRGWKLDRSFPGRGYINRGFGGSQLADSVHFADRLIIKHEPRIVVVYAGDNDLAAGKTPEQVAADFNALVMAVHAKLPETRIIWLSIKPSIKRWNIVEKGRAANRLIESACQADKRLVFVDVFNPLLGNDGMPRKDLLIEDGLHLNDKGYELWTKVLSPYLEPVKE